MQFIMSGAEPIRADTMDSFLSTFAECGLRDGVFCSAYGLAEHVCGNFNAPCCIMYIETKLILRAHLGVLLSPS